MADTATKPEKVQLYLRSDQLDRLHQLKGQQRGTSISGFVVEAVDLFFAENDSKPRKRARSSRSPVTAA